MYAFFDVHEGLVSTSVRLLHTSLYLALLLLEVQVWNLAQLFDEFGHVRIFDWLWRYDNLHREVLEHFLEDVLDLLVVCRNVNGFQRAVVLLALHRIVIFVGILFITALYSGFVQCQEYLSSFRAYCSCLS